MVIIERTLTQVTTLRKGMIILNVLISNRMRNYYLKSIVMKKQRKVKKKQTKFIKKGHFK